MAYEVEVSRQARVDRSDVFAFLHESFAAFGDDDSRAFERAASRIRQIDDTIASLGAVPHRVTLRPDLGPTIRSVTKDRAILYFEVLDKSRTLRVLAIFFGGQDHLAAMRARMRG